MLKKLIGDREFYRKLFAVMIPVLIQNVITNFVSLLDNIMVGRIGTEPMSGVAIVNQILFIFWKMPLIFEIHLSQPMSHMNIFAFMKLDPSDSIIIKTWILVPLYCYIKFAYLSYLL